MSSAPLLSKLTDVNTHFSIPFNSCDEVSEWVDCLRPLQETHLIAIHEIVT